MKIIKYILEWIKYSFSNNKKQEPEKEVKIIKTDLCNVKTCNQKLNVLNGFKCHYCKKYFCEEHRLPEEHKCRRKLKVPEEMRAGTQIQSYTFERGVG